ncbi:hypothetical protein O3W52_28055 [Ensifer psoraleae]|uniref:Uncharacterized protein n=1 Tax=Sinorhizobium psoraleae TaxID=520838 RepID=A0ABT4KRX7_9HYPH|nr:hypothetical protein [Sinorhizobium psoraleae]MCZ4093657.1 hypothetical protein [Sinorhizobium psoraleae]
MVDLRARAQGLPRLSLSPLPAHQQTPEGCGKALFPGRDRLHQMFGLWLP